MSQSKNPTEQCDFCGRKAVSFAAACGHHRVCFRCNVTKKATSACSACLKTSRMDDDEYSDLNGNIEECDSLLQPSRKNSRKPSWLTSATQPKTSKSVSTYVQQRQPILETMSIPQQTSQPAPIMPIVVPQNCTTTSSEAGISDNISAVDRDTALATEKCSPTRVHRKPRRLQGQIASHMHSKPEKILQATKTHSSDLDVTDKQVVPAGSLRDSGSSPWDEGQGVASWRAKTPGAIMYSELRGIPTMYDQRRPRIPWEFQSFANLGERCALMSSEETGDSPPPRDLDENDQIVIGQGDVTQPDFELDDIELEQSDDEAVDYEESPLSSSVPSTSSRENNTSPCKAQRITYDSSWVVPDGSFAKQDSEDDDSASDFDREVEGPGFESNDDEGDDDFWVATDRITRKGFAA